MEGGRLSPFTVPPRPLSLQPRAGRPAESRLLKPFQRSTPPPLHRSRRTCVRAGGGGALEPRTRLRERGERRHAGPTRGRNVPRPGREHRPETVRPPQQERGKGGGSLEGVRKPGWGAERRRRGEGARERRRRERRGHCGELDRGGGQVAQGNGQRRLGPAWGRGEAGRGAPGGSEESPRRGREAPGNSRTTGHGDSGGAWGPG